MTRVLVCAGDASGDLHAADLVRELSARRPELRFVGMGGDALEKAGVELVVHQRELALSGIAEIAAGLPRIVRVWRAMNRALREHDPALVILVDSGGFNLPFAKRVRRVSGAKILYFIAPQVWAWRTHRVAKIAARVDRLAVIFPFEPEIYAGRALDVDYVGHPLVEKLAALAGEVDRGAARRELGIDGDAPLVAVFPGSRRNEVRRQLPVQLAAIGHLHAAHPEVAFALVVAPSLERAPIEAMVRAAGLPADLRLSVHEGRSRLAILASDVALAKPGTVTIEIALLDRPMVVVGCTSELTAIVLRRTIKVPSYTMPNLISGSQIVPEFLQEDADPLAIADAVACLFAGEKRGRQLVALAEVKRALGRGGAAENASAIAEEMLGHPQT